METPEYDPAEDEGVKKLEELRKAGATEQELRHLELSLTEQTNNGPKDSDPVIES
jgi:hypothetical protein